jgi:hypothetical protein
MALTKIIRVKRFKLQVKDLVVIFIYLGTCFDGAGVAIVSFLWEFF